MHIVYPPPHPQISDNHCFQFLLGNTVVPREDSGYAKFWGANKVHRVLKWWRHKNEISEIVGFVRIFWKNNVQEAYLPKMNISGQIVSEMLAG